MACRSCGTSSLTCLIHCMCNQHTCAYWHSRDNVLQAITLHQLSRDVSRQAWTCGAVPGDGPWSTSKLRSAVCSDYETHSDFQAYLTWSASITGKRVCQRQIPRLSPPQKWGCCLETVTWLACNGSCLLYQKELCSFQARLKFAIILLLHWQSYILVY